MQREDRITYSCEKCPNGPCEVTVCAENIPPTCCVYGTPAFTTSRPDFTLTGIEVEILDAVGAENLNLQEVSS